MPTYEYVCKSCGKQFEVFIKSSEKSQVNCPQCASHELRELYGFNVSKSGSTRNNTGISCDSCPSQNMGFG